MTKYNNAKIYYIQNKNKKGDIYIGSTTKKYLSQRMSAHRYCYEKYKKGNVIGSSANIIFDKYGIDNCGIFLIDNVDCSNRKQLRQIEKEYIRKYKCVNELLTD